MINTEPIGGKGVSCWNLLVLGQDFCKESMRLICLWNVFRMSWCVMQRIVSLRELLLRYLRFIIRFFRACTHKLRYRVSTFLPKLRYKQ